ncbi:MAG: DUF2007 domain-containing protein [Marinilabiliales bacterium]|nr:DUF2007 domain-containing protein [Marinilabiliales bacterium]
MAISDDKPIDARKSRMVMIFAGTPWQASMVKNLLELEGIESFLSEMNRADYNAGWNLAGSQGSTRLFILEDALDPATGIVEAYQRTQLPAD